MVVSVWKFDFYVFFDGFVAKIYFVKLCFGTNSFKIHKGLWTNSNNKVLRLFILC